MTDSIKPAPADRMPSALGACSRFCRDKIGWNKVGLVVSLIIIGVAFWVLYHILKDIDVD
jgi:hypothetical protein